MNKNARSANVWLWLTVPIAILLVIAAGSGIFISGLYRDTPNLVAQAIAQDAITLVVAFPTLIIGAFLASRGSHGARLVWPGVLVYTVYTYVGYAFDIRFNPLFLVYVALLGCSTYALIGGLVTTDLSGIKGCFTAKTPVKAVSIYLGAIAVLFYFLWLSEAVPASLAGKTPQSVIDAGTPTNLVHVLDMAWILPALAITAVSLWRKRALGYTLAGALLSYLVLLILAILSMVVFMIRDGHPVAVPQVVIFGTLFAIGLGMLIWYIAFSPFLVRANNFRLRLSRTKMGARDHWGLKRGKDLENWAMASACWMSGFPLTALNRAWLVFNGYAIFHRWPKSWAFFIIDLERQLTTTHRQPAQGKKGGIGSLGLIAEASISDGRLRHPGLRDLLDCLVLDLSYRLGLFCCFGLFVWRLHFKLNER